MKNEPVLRDERYYAVENASYKIGYIILTYGLFLLIIIRSILYKESNWDLFALVIVSSLAATFYQWKHKVLPFTKKWIFYLLAVAVVSAVVAYVIGTLLR